MLFVFTCLVVVAACQGYLLSRPQAGKKLSYSRLFSGKQTDAASDAVESLSSVRIVCLQSKGKAESTNIVANSAKTSYRSSSTLYNDRKEEIADKVMDSPLANVFTILFNPTSLVLALYFSSIAWTKVSWMNKLLRIFGRGDSKSQTKDSDSSVDDAPLQIFECEVCQMEMRPAKGRADVIFGRDRFRCSRCGAKASAYFNVDDMTDERAVARMERIKKKEEEDDNYGDDEVYD